MWTCLHSCMWKNGKAEFVRQRWDPISGVSVRTVNIYINTYTTLHRSTIIIIFVRSSPLLPWHGHKGNVVLIQAITQVWTHYKQPPSRTPPSKFDIGLWPPLFSFFFNHERCFLLFIRLFHYSNIFFLKKLYITLRWLFCRFI